MHRTTHTPRKPTRQNSSHHHHPYNSSIRKTPKKDRDRVRDAARAISPSPLTRRPEGMQRSGSTGSISSYKGSVSPVKEDVNGKGDGWITMPARGDGRAQSPVGGFGTPNRRDFTTPQQQQQAAALNNGTPNQASATPYHHTTPNGTHLHINFSPPAPPTPTPNGTPYSPHTHLPPPLHTPTPHHTPSTPSKPKPTPSPAPSQTSQVPAWFSFLQRMRQVIDPSSSPIGGKRKRRRDQDEDDDGEEGDREGIKRVKFAPPPPPPPPLFSSPGTSRNGSVSGEANGKVPEVKKLERKRTADEDEFTYPAAGLNSPPQTQDSLERRTIKKPRSRKAVVPDGEARFLYDYEDDELAL